MRRIGLRPRAELGHFCITPRYRGHGYGERQLRHVLEHLAAIGFDEIVIRTNGHEFFAPARHVYRKSGFREIAREPGTLSVPFDTIVFSRSLAPDPAPRS